MSKFHSLALAASVFGLAACSTNDAKTLGATSAASVMSSQSAFDAFSKIPQATLSANFNAVGKMNFSQLYTMLSKVTTNNTVIVDGHSFVNQLTQLTAHRDAILSLGNTYQTVADYWKAKGITGASANQNVFANGMKSLEAADSAVAPASLGLLTPHVLSYSAKNPDSDNCNTVLDAFGAGGAQTSLNQIGSAMAAAANDAVNQLYSAGPGGADTGSATSAPQSVSQSSEISATATAFHPGESDTPAYYISAWHAFVDGGEDTEAAKALGGTKRSSDCFRQLSKPATAATSAS